MSPDISIVMAAHNEREHLELALQSVQDQTLTNWELIVVDDASSDGTERILQRYAQADDRIRVLTNAQQCGLPACLNLAIRQARADLIARFDADDINLPDRLERQYSFMLQNDGIDVLGTGAQLMDSAGRTLGSTLLPEDHAGLAVRRLTDSHFFHPSVMIRRRFFDVAGLYDERFLRAQDKELWLRGLQRGCRYANLPEVLIRYRTSDKTQTWSRLWYNTQVLARIGRMYRVPGYWRQLTFFLVRTALVKLRLYTPRSFRKGA